MKLTEISTAMEVRYFIFLIFPLFVAPSIFVRGKAKFFTARWLQKSGDETWNLRYPKPGLELGLCST